MQLLKASKWVEDFFLYFVVKACKFKFSVRWISWQSFPQMKNQINKPASKFNEKGMLIAFVFHYVAAVEEHE